MKSLHNFSGIYVFRDPVDMRKSYDGLSALVQASFGERGFQCGVIVDERTGKTVTNSACLARFAAAMNVHHDVECAIVVRQNQRLHHDHATGFAGEILVKGLAVNNNVALTAFDKHTGDRALASSGSVVIFTDHGYLSILLCNELVDCQRFGLLCAVGV